MKSYHFYVIVLILEVSMPRLTCAVALSLLIVLADGVGRRVGMKPAGIGTVRFCRE